MTGDAYRRRSKDREFARIGLGRAGW